jgi:hypothetical protein
MELKFSGRTSPSANGTRYRHDRMEFLGAGAGVYNRFLAASVGDLTNTDWCDIVLVGIQSLENGTSNCFDWEGNSWQIDLDRKTVKIYFQTDFDYCHSFPLTEFKRALLLWRDFLARENPQDTDEVIAPFPTADTKGV